MGEQKSTRVDEGNNVLMKSSRDKYEGRYCSGGAGGGLLCDPGSGFRKGNEQEKEGRR